jgi:oligopeptide transport system substrate-binding protein
MINHNDMKKIFALAFLIGGCSNFVNEAPPSLTQVKETLSVALPQNPISFNWTESSNVTNDFLATSLMDGLTKIDLEDAETNVHADLAESFTESSDFLNVNFILNKKVRWSDGESISSDNFIFTLETLLDPKNLNEIPLALFNIKNARAYHEGKIKKFSDVGIKILSDTRFTLNLEEPQPGFAAVFSQPTTFPTRRDLFNKWGSHWSDLEHLVTLGAYRVAKIEKRRITLVKNEKSFRAAEIQIKNVLIYFGLGSADAIKLFNLGKLDVIFDVSQKDADSLKDREEYLSIPLFDVTFLSINVRGKPLSSPIFRRALGMSIDRAEIVRTVGGAKISIGEMIPPGLTGYESNRGVRFDSEAAVDLLKHSGFKDLSMMKLKLFTPQFEDARETAQNIQAQLKRNLHVETEILTESNVGTAGDVTESALHISRIKSVIADPSYFLNSFRSKSSSNITGWKNKKFDDFLFSAMHSTSQDSKDKFFAKAQHVLNDEEMPVLPLFANSYGILIQKRVKDFPVNGFKLAPLYGVTFQ